MAKRWHAHCELFLAMFEAAADENRPVYTADLAAISRNHTARISQLRNRGHVIKCEDVPADDPRYGKGATRYRYLGCNERAAFEKQLDEVTALYERIMKLKLPQRVALVQAVIASHPGQTTAFFLAA